MSSRRDRGDFVRGGDSYRPRSPPPTMRHFTGTDSYRPDIDRRSQADFSFRMPGAPRFSPEPPSQPAGNRRRPQQFRGGARGRGGFRNHHASDRDILRTKRQTTPEQLDGMNSNGTARFMALEDVSDSEAEMDMSSDEDTPAEGRVSKRARTTGLSEPDAAPKWSNPDPYTALPPPDESQAKKKDVVKLIRKAKLAASNEAAVRNAAAENADFISFNFDDEVIQVDSSDASGEDETPTGGSAGPPRFSHLDNLHPERFERPDTAGTFSQDRNVAALQAPGTLQTAAAAALDVWPPPDVNTAVGKIEPQLDQNTLPPPPQNSKKRKRAAATLDGGIVEDWLPRGGQSTTPWCVVDHSRTEGMGFWLHKEICDFYEYVKPHDFEERLRQDLISRISRSLEKNPYYRNAQLLCFGSFAAGLYLPTSDMDLVLVSPDFRSKGLAKFGVSRSQMYGFAAMLERGGIIQSGSLEVIAKAKVPIIKFVDRVTGLKVDISFENLGGVNAVATFQRWKAQFPAMPIIVALVKQLLLMRGLNEVYVGGIGGFSVICLVVSLMQHLPAIQSGAMIGEQNLGELLLNFFDLYGNKFNIATTGISMEPPGYYVKRAGPQNKSDRLAISDPNNPANDISNGSHRVDLVLESFSEAYASLTRRMYQLETSDLSSRKGSSILSSVFAGNYSSYEGQRNRLRRIYAELCSSAPAVYQHLDILNIAKELRNEQPVQDLAKPMTFEEFEKAVCVKSMTSDLATSTVLEPPLHEQRVTHPYGVDSMGQYSHQQTPAGSVAIPAPPQSATALSETTASTETDVANRSRAEQLKRDFPHAGGIPDALTREEYLMLRPKLRWVPEPEETRRRNAERLRNSYPEARHRIPDLVATFAVEKIMSDIMYERHLAWKAKTSTDVRRAQ